MIQQEFDIEEVYLGAMEVLTQQPHDWIQTRINTLKAEITKIGMRMQVLAAALAMGSIQAGDAYNARMKLVRHKNELEAELKCRRVAQRHYQMEESKQGFNGTARNDARTGSKEHVERTARIEQMSRDMNLGQLTDTRLVVLAGETASVITGYLVALRPYYEPQDAYALELRKRGIEPPNPKRMADEAIARQS